MKTIRKLLILFVLFSCLFGCYKEELNYNKKPSLKEEEKKQEDMDNSAITKIAFIGDSITYGTNSSDPITKSYPSQLKTLLGDGYEIMNFGYGGSCVISDKDDNNLYFKKEKYYRNSPQYKESLKYDSDIVIIMLGTNDRTSIYTNEKKLISEGADSLKYWLSDIANEYKDLGSKVYIASSIYSPVENEAPKEYLDGMVQKLQKEVADEYGFGYIDIYTPTREYFEDLYYFSSDRLHPNDEGYKKIAEVFFDYINSNKIIK